MIGPPLAPWSEKHLGVLHPPTPPAHRPDPLIDRLSHAIPPPGRRLDLECTAMIPPQRSLVLPSNERSTMWTLSGRRLIPLPGWKLSGNKWLKTDSITSPSLSPFTPEVRHPNSSISSIVPSQDAHGSEFVAAPDKRREWISGSAPFSWISCVLVPDFLPLIQVQRYRRIGDNLEKLRVPVRRLEVLAAGN